MTVDIANDRISVRGGYRMGLEKINELKKAKGLTNEDLSRLSGVPKSTLDKITSGLTTNPSLETVKSIMYALGKTLDDLEDISNRAANDKHTQLLEEFEKLNESGQQRAIENITDLTYVPRYTETERQILSEEELEEAKALGYDLDNPDDFVAFDKETLEPRPLTDAEKYRYKREVIDPLLQKNRKNAGSA